NRRGAMYFNWLEMLDTNVTVILLLMGIVAAFTLISSMFVIVLERVRMIGLLKSLGAGNAFVQRIFIAILTRLVIRGLVIGNVIAGLIIVLQKATHILRLDPATYFIDHVAMRISLWEILALNLGVLLMAVLVLILPSRIVCGISPARSLRFE
ncbi:MAG: ABC transporter permease, partial [Muribaculaceae bacterium]|nr:ABC transporter permease [Muribaculaceae bacterium]